MVQYLQGWVAHCVANELPISCPVCRHVFKWDEVGEFNFLYHLLPTVQPSQLEQQVAPDVQEGHNGDQDGDVELDREGGGG